MQSLMFAVFLLFTENFSSLPSLGVSKFLSNSSCPSIPRISTLLFLDKERAKGLEFYGKEFVTGLLPGKYLRLLIKRGDVVCDIRKFAALLREIAPEY